MDLSFMVTQSPARPRRRRSWGCRNWPVVEQAARNPIIRNSYAGCFVGPPISATSSRHIDCSEMKKVPRRRSAAGTYMLNHILASELGHEREPQQCREEGTAAVQPTV